MRYTYAVPPTLAADMRAAVRNYAQRFGVSEAESWRVLEERIQEEANREVRLLLDAEVRRMLDGGA